ncbi:TPA: hypothetical protein OMT95_001037 [Enterobacter kobei]|uniref:hypothetical protein n=1 Tax=Enterobacter hormaechei TaxID=158836 RepID=UPI0011E3FC2B|nr:hypothetical protein [Enterobacter hormaechei]TYF67667.1 hypothetical protein DJ539_24575 [Enterobacter hormaechei]HCR1068485.1 hypothetical protein [Enterobacter kobei]
MPVLYLQWRLPLDQLEPAQQAGTVHPVAHHHSVHLFPRLVVMVENMARLVQLLSVWYPI